MADRVNGHVTLGYRWFEPDKIFRRKSFYIAQFQIISQQISLLKSHSLKQKFQKSTQVFTFTKSNHEKQRKKNQQETPTALIIILSSV